MRMSYLSPESGTPLQEVVKEDGSTVYRDRSSAVEYSKEYLEQVGAKSAREESAPAPSSEPVDEDPNADLKGLKRGQLNAVAEEEGLNPKDYNSIPALTEAIIANRAEPEDSDES